MKSLNTVTLLGNLGQDPELRATASGTSVANLSLATNDYAGKNPDGSRNEITNWHRVTFWGRLAEVANEFARKGDRVLVVGEIRYGKYTDRDGVERYSTDIIGKDLVLLGGMEAAARPPAPSRPATRPEKPLTEPDDDLPF